jgi:hypothetical protein
MSPFNHKYLPLFFYLGILQIITALCTGIVGLLFIKFGEGKVFDIILGFLPDVEMLTWSTIGLFMLIFEIFGNLVGAGLSFVKSNLAGNIAIVLGGSEMFWMVFQYLVLHIHSILMLLFFVLALIQMIMGYLIRKNIINRINHERNN